MARSTGKNPGRRATAIHAAPLAPGRVRILVAALIALHVVLATWGAARQSVTFDENFHLPAGVLEAARGELRVSALNPPLVKAIAGAAALAAGARIPSDEAMGDGEQGRVGFAFMQANAARYHRVFFAARLVNVALSALLAWIVWRWARRLWGSRGGLVALAFYVTAPEALAHAGVMTMDVPTALGFTSTLFAWQGFVRSGRWRYLALASFASGFTFLVRFSAVLLPALLALFAVIEVAAGRSRAPKRVGLGFAVLLVSTLLLLNAGYLFRTSFEPLRELPLQSRPWRALAASAPDLRLPLPDTYLMGFDRQALDSETGHTRCFLLGTIHDVAPMSYFPIAFLAKWPLGFLAALALLAVFTVRRGRAARRMMWPVLTATLFLASLVFVGRMGVGIRYALPLVPLLAISLGALGRERGFGSPRWRQAAIALACVQSLEMAANAPWHLSFYNALAGGAARGQWIVNDSNVDWGQGLIALREELAARGISKVHLAYHGTTDPAIYGIDYVPYLGGQPGPESDWIAISSYYFVGLSQRMTTSQGRTSDAVMLDFRPLWARQPEARPAGCMLLFKLR